MQPPRKRSVKKPCKKIAIIAALILWYLLAPSVLKGDESKLDVAAKQSNEQGEVQAFLQKKHSPLADNVAVLLQQKQWRLIIAISAIESSYCLHSIGNNCWGIKGGDGYRQYPTLAAAIPDVESLIERRQAQGKWLTVESMNCSYVVPCNPNWVAVVNQNLIQLNKI